ncbi:hypothetical protein [Chitinophaga silvisoli]|uniref:Porin n=1 Tax=Chitinophaga silvisoli TaxID=2291814 RepID=A0A3E1NV05_9BACT|nr:hypothetical protein [Chitinophaga silvisoli]RFM31749.1 hypothetical protein DXN04_26650 [Chitinophaga silvisoli]
MKFFPTTLLIIFIVCAQVARAEENPPRKKRKSQLLKELPASINKDTANDVSGSDAAPFKPSIQVGAIVHMFAGAEQDGFGSPSAAEAAKDWSKSFTLYRARVLVGGQLSKKGSFFMETDLPSAIGVQLSTGNKSTKVSPILLDCQYEYDFSNAFQLVAGMQLVSNNRNGLQGAAGLMANDFTYFQYPYNLFENSPLNGNFGRDLGVNARGFLAKDKLEYRLGVFTGRNTDGKAPLRTVGRLAYSFLDPDKDYYYAGTKLGNGKTFTWGAGFDAQGSYYNLSTDVFLDKPLGQAGSLTLNAAFQYMTGGTDTLSKYSFARMIPRQTVQFLELGYYFKEPKLQPWVRFENQHIISQQAQTSGVPTYDFDQTNSSYVVGGGLNYFFNGTGTNLRLSYTTRSYDVKEATGYADKTFGQVWLQVQFFIF